MGLKGIQTVPPPEKCKIFVVIFPFTGCFKKQVLFLLEAKAAARGAEGGGNGRVFVISLWFAKKHHQMKKSRNPA